MKLFDLDHPFFIPVWRRVAIVAFCLGWTVVELTRGSPYWALFFAGLGLYCGWYFRFRFNPRKPDETGQGKDGS